MHTSITMKKSIICHLVYGPELQKKESERLT